jgi:putative transcription factor
MQQDHKGHNPSHHPIKTMQDWEQVYLTKPIKIENKNNSVKNQSNQKEIDEFNLKKPSLDFQKTLQQARLTKKLTQKDLALKAGIQLNILQGYENGKEIPSNLIISKLEKILNTKLPRIYKKE